MSKDIKKDYEYIGFYPADEWYYPKSIELGNLKDVKKYIEHDKIDIPLGKSRIGGPIVDLPNDVDYPKNLFFTAQLNLEEFDFCYFNDYLPQKGFLYFFIGGYGNTGKVIYSDCSRNKLVRVIIEHDNWFFDGCLIQNIYLGKESVNDRYDEEWGSVDGKYGWNPFAGSNMSKIFGIFTNCQYAEEDIKTELVSDKLLLLQISVQSISRSKRV